MERNYVQFRGMKRKFYFYIIVICTAFSGRAQEDIWAKKYLAKGIEAYDQKNYKLAESWFIKSIENEPCFATYYNLANTKEKLGDHCGYCEYIEKAVSFGDKDTEKQLNLKCLTIDTNYYKYSHGSDTSSYSVIKNNNCNNTKIQIFYKQIEDEKDYSFSFIDTSYKICIKTFNSFPDMEANLNDIIIYNPDKSPEYTGGQDKLDEFLKKNIHTPVGIYGRHIQGMVRALLLVDVNGTVRNVRISTGVDPILDNEVIRVGKLMPPLIPGKYKNKPINSEFPFFTKFYIN